MPAKKRKQETSWRDISIGPDPFAEEKRLEQERLQREKEEEALFELEQAHLRMLNPSQGVHPAFRAVFGG